MCYRNNKPVFCPAEWLIHLLWSQLKGISLGKENLTPEYFVKEGQENMELFGLFVGMA